MPGVDAQHLAHLARSSSNSSIHIEDSKLFMPSDLSNEQRQEYCTPGLADAEDRLRYAEACDALEDLRRHLRTRTFTNKFRIKNVRGQKQSMRTREIQHRIDDKVKISQLQYTRARQAVRVLRGAGDWEDTLKVLLLADVRALNERVLTRLEMAEERRVRDKGKQVASDSDDADMGRTTDDSEDDLEEIRVTAKPADLGSGNLRPSWIWYATSNSEDMSDPVMRSGK